jgi:TonB family protein
MYEIWWRDRLLDVVPRVGELPEGLHVRSRPAEHEPIPDEPRDWSFPKLVIFVALFFFAAVSMLEVTPPDEGEPSTASFARVILRTPPAAPPKLVPTRLKERTHELFAHAGTQPQTTKTKLSSFGGIWGTVGPIGSGLGPVDALLSKLGGGGSDSGGLPGFGGSRGGGAGPGFGPGLDIGSGPARLPRPSAGLGPKRDEGPPKEITTIGDGLPRDVVAKVIRAHFNEIKYCYERELQSQQSLAGKVSVSFTIGPTGEVLETSISESTLANEAVESCMLARIRRWRFPDPAGGGVVTVNHPWIFRGAGDNTP